MYSPVFLSWPTTSGSPPVRSISLSDHIFSEFPSSLAWTLAHCRPLWRFILSSNRAFKVLRSSSRCFGDRSFLTLLFFFVPMDSPMAVQSQVAESLHPNRQKFRSPHYGFVFS